MTLTCPYALFGASAKSRIHETYARMQEDAAVIRVLTHGERVVTWFVTRYEEVEAVLRDDDRFVRDPALALPPEELTTLQLDPVLRLVTENMLNKDGPAHRRLRRLVARAFTPQHVRAMTSHVRRISEELVGRVSDAGEMDFIADFAYPLPLLVVGELLGIPLEERDKLREWSATFVKPVNDAPALASFIQHMEAFIACIRRILERRDTGRAGNLVDDLRRATDASDSLSESEFLSMIILFVVAGHETTVNLFGNGMLALLQHPQRIDELRQHPERIDAAVEELLRYDPPLDRGLTRWAACDTKLAGFDVRRGDRVVVLIAAANRDPGRFSSPHEVDFSRGLNPPHFTFGRGVHACPGAGLARLEGRIGLATVLTTLPDLRLGVDASELRWREMPQMRSLERLPICWSRPRRLAQPPIS